MKPDIDYFIHYDSLEISEGCSWPQLRKAYRLAVKKWHPDHFHQDQEKKAIAEKKIKEINKAFEVLSAYYKKHGKLPSSAKKDYEARREPPRRPAPSSSSAPAKEPFSEASGAASPRRDSKQSRPRRFSKRRWTVTAIVLIGLIYIMKWLFEDPEQELEQTYETAYVSKPSALYQHFQEPATKPGADKDQKEKEKTDQYFSYGSSLGEVYDVQGVPTKIENENIWYYGKSKVFFKQGVVVKWEEDISNPLKASLNRRSKKPASRYFTIGSTKDDVRAIQGTPSKEMENSWVYGFSKVHFKAGLVSGWYESPMDPLKARK